MRRPDLLAATVALRFWHQAGRARGVRGLGRMPAALSCHAQRVTTTTGLKCQPGACSSCCASPRRLHAHPRDRAARCALASRASATVDTIDVGSVKALARPKPEPARGPPSGIPLWSVPLSVPTATQACPIFSASRRPVQAAVVAPVAEPSVAPTTAPIRARAGCSLRWGGWRRPRRHCGFPRPEQPEGPQAAPGRKPRRLETQRRRGPRGHLQEGQPQRDPGVAASGRRRWNAGRSLRGNPTACRGPAKRVICAVHSALDTEERRG